MEDEHSPASWLPGLGVDFMHRVYRTTAIVAVLLGALAWERFGAKVGIGWAFGVLLSLGVLVSVELTVRRFIRPEEQSVRSMTLLTVGKMGVIFALLFLAFLGAKQGWLNLLGVAAGFPLPGFIFVLKLVGLKLVEGSRSR
jgi:hypothetical protein